MNKIEHMKKMLLHDETGGPLGQTRKPVGVPVISPFADWDYYYLMGEISWEPDSPSDGSFSKVVVPIGFITDLASTPSIFWSLLPPASTYTHAAIIHDFLYWSQHCTRQYADELFNIMMKEFDVAAAKRIAIFTAVDKLGSKAWNTNALLKKKGEKRILKKFPNDPRISWQKWKNEQDVFL